MEQHLTINEGLHALELEVVTDAQANVMAVAALVAQEAVEPDTREIQSENQRERTAE